MQAAKTTTRGDAPIDEWTTHCPSCARPVDVKPGEDAVACPHCHAAFAPVDNATKALQRPAAAPPVDPNDELVGRTLGDWRLVRLIGRGGMGRVYEAQAVAGRRRVAVKVLSEDLAADPAFVKRFRREGTVLASLSHPHVVEILDRGESDGRLYFAMEYIRGENLRRRLQRGLPAPEEAVRIATEVASALAYAHGHGIVHRDLKPENVLLDEEGRVHLVDFGLSRLAGDGGGGATTMLTRTDVILGTYEYMAPEQRRGDKDLDARADVFALGVILYEMLTGQLPLGRFAPPSSGRTDVPASLDAVVNRALATDRSARYDGAESMRQALAGVGARPRKAKTPPLPPSRRGGRPPKPPLLPESEIADLRGMLRHVDILSALDRVLGVILILGAFGLFSLHRVVPVLPVGGIVLFIGGVVFLQVAGKLSRMQSGSRDGQITLSVILLLLPPVLTVMGLYGLFVLTGEKSRRAFALGRKRLEGPLPAIAQRVVEVERPLRKQPPWLLLRAVFLSSLVWVIYATFVVLDGPGGPRSDASLAETLRMMSDERLLAVWISVIGVLVSLGYAVAAVLHRKTRRGLGLALTALLLFAISATVLSNLHRVNRIGYFEANTRAESTLPHLCHLSPLRHLERAA